LELRPEAKNLLTIYAALADQQLESVVLNFAGKQFSALKADLVDLAVEKLSPITEKMNQLMAHPDEIRKILQKGADHAESIASVHLKEIREDLGTWPL
ncbi:MAG: tryptophan--tRNA ligase, partial [Alphaproteobacteria bacterium]|nr:tryptophan--tRNA ligase [Alphaproteobacteria bacterium]